MVTLKEAAQQALEAYDAHDPLGIVMEDLRTALAEQPAEQEPVASPTAGMNIAQRILHVGGRNNAAGYVEFGSIQAVEALVRHVIRDLPAPQPAKPVEQEPEGSVCGRCGGLVFDPVLPQPAKRVPLTDGQIAEIAATPCAVVGSYVHTFARAIEAAHGITGETK